MRRRWTFAAAASSALAIVVVASSATADPDRVVVSIEQDGQLERCGQIQVRGDDASGGCDLEVAQAPLDLAALTVFGDRALGRCGLTYRMQVGGDGEIVLTDFILSAPGDVHHSICGDVLPCRRDLQEIHDIEKLPWRGTLARDDEGLHANVGACFDTCFGRFEGTVSFTVTPTGAGLRLSGDDAAIGVSGLEISGSWKMTPFYGGKLRLDGG